MITTSAVVFKRSHLTFVQYVKQTIISLFVRLRSKIKSNQIFYFLARLRKMLASMKIFAQIADLRL